MHAGLLHAATNGEGPQAFPAMTAVAREPGRTLFQDFPHPVQRLHVVLESRAAKQTDLRYVRRAQPGLSPLAFDGFDHRRLFAANIGARAPPQMDGRERVRGSRLKRRDLTLQNGAAAMILVAQVNVDGVDADRPCRDQRALEKTVRIPLQIVTVLEGSRLPFVDIDRHQARRRLGRYQPPFAAGGKSRTTESAQSRILHHLDNFSSFFASGNAGNRKRIAPARPVGGVIDMAWGHNAICLGMGNATGLDGFRDLVSRRVGDRILTDYGDRRGFASAYAWRM